MPTRVLYEAGAQLVALLGGEGRVDVAGLLHLGRHEVGVVAQLPQQRYGRQRVDGTQPREQRGDDLGAKDLGVHVHLAPHGPSEFVGGGAGLWVGNSDVLGGL